MKAGAKSCGAQTAEAKEAPSTAASAFVMRERGAQKLTKASAEMGDRRSGDLTASVASSTGGYFRHGRCSLEKAQ